MGLDKVCGCVRMRQAQNEQRRRDMAQTRYKLVDTSTLKGLKQAERLHVQGWLTARNGLFTVLFYKRQTKEERQ